jgi:hypothetical protein
MRQEGYHLERSHHEPLAHHLPGENESDNNQPDQDSH